MGEVLTDCDRQERRHYATQASHSALLLVGHVTGKTCILVDDLADTSNTITRAAKLLKKEGATKVYALVTHGVLSGDGVERIFHSGLDKVHRPELVSRVCELIRILSGGGDEQCPTG